MNVLARTYNFTYVSNRDAEGDWGVLPKSGKITF
jgi:hypothetical protein